MSDKKANLALLPLASELILDLDIKEVLTLLIRERKLKQSYIGQRIGLSQARVSQIYSGTHSGDGIDYNARSRLLTLCALQGLEPNNVEGKKR